MPISDWSSDVCSSDLLDYLQAKNTADADTVYAMLSSELASYASPAAWKETRRALNARLGAGAEAAVVRLTWYDDPQNAPTPGRYAAADYRVAYPNEAFACGSVVWRTAERRVGKERVRK